MAKHPRIPKTSQRDHDQTSEATPDYEIGFRQPPVHRRFKPGQTGNPKGRPKGRRKVRTVVEEALNKRITIREGDRTRSLPKLDGVVLTMVNKALQGDAKALTALIQLIRSLGMTEEIPEPTSTEPVTAHDDEIIADFLRRHGASTNNTAASDENAPNNRQSTPPGKETKP
jgi:hypothetical protein